MRTLLLVCLVLACLLLPIEGGKKPSKSQKKTMKLFKKLSKDVKKYQKDVDTMTADLDQVNMTASVSTRHTLGTDSMTVVDAVMTGTICGPNTLTSWSVGINYYTAASASTDSADPFSAGTFTAVINGWYHICSFSRFRNTGNANDVTVLVGGSIVAAYGSGITEDWRTTGVCFDAYLAANTQVQVRHQSGGSSDCIEYTGWPHNKFTVHTIANGNP